ncbi:alpha-mannosyltransferase KNAG_0D05360 [Huiozyma naganishii CBS 8797]|uniref:Glycosyltransferase family 71 protein n=1 Tax=Huiozyma naganishii (strain ATCC MYA-139 / BCRC 22969 / CBS 8797 / KCTC 17520 / NBRC 10181 / NCYC 3082 / Yp74L-3) TaxID=1071383 RepID=J7S699_HUIN7|nr:hypothetical protein KNAG_0D05360 [Kazachstania naganishii CBS 8797]CCK70274.1 hypothetical protein KNAG_0D05360 [Kazachstania naganishii CBS 8797]
MAGNWALQLVERTNYLPNGLPMTRGPISREEKCKVLVEALYHDNDDWSHQQNMNGFPSDHANEEFASVMMERLRIYNYCFIEGGIDVADVWSPQLGSSPLEFQHSMFPFLRIPGEGEDALLPTVVDLSTMHKVPLHPAQLDIHNHNRNFWRSWSNMAQGRGIVTTFSAKKFSDFFFRQLKVLQYHNNELPIQIIVQDNEFSDDFIAEIAAAGERTKQSLYLVKISKLLDPANQKYLSGWINKLLANLFNTFEEFILLDADVVPYAAPHTYFSTKEYTSTGLYMFQDRALLSETETICTDTLNSLEPSKQEVELLGSYLQFTHTMDLQGKTQEESTYTALFKKKLPHNVETGLVTANKKSKMFGLVTSLMLNLNTKLRACFWGDKEFYWLGPLFAGVSYTIEPTPAALTGFPLRRYENDIYQNTTLCDTHIAHVRDHELSWINGGLRTFKPEANINYKNIENPPAKMSGCLIPDPAHGPWVREKRVFGHIHCAAVVEPDLDLTPYGEVIRFDEETQQRTDDISKIWNSNIDEHV